MITKYIFNKKLPTTLKREEIIWEDKENFKYDTNAQKTRNRSQLNNKAPKRCCSIFSGIKKISAGNKIYIATVAMKIA